MPSVVGICNLALSHIGDVADVQSVFPPDGSVQAGFCSRFYPIALSALLEKSNWNFSTFRAGLAEIANPSTTWRHAYAVPTGMINAISVLPPYARDDYSQHSSDRNEWFHPAQDCPNPADNIYTPQPYSMETQEDGSQIILTNVWDAVLRYTVQVEDPNQFSPTFVLALSYLLASMLAGPLIKGDVGIQVSGAMEQKAQSYTGAAATSDANQRRIELQQRVPWMAGR